MTSLLLQLLLLPLLCPLLATPPLHPDLGSPLWMFQGGIHKVYAQIWRFWLWGSFPLRVARTFSWQLQLWVYFFPSQPYFFNNVYMTATKKHLVEIDTCTTTHRETFTFGVLFQPLLVELFLWMTTRRPISKQGRVKAKDPSLTS